MATVSDPSSSSTSSTWTDPYKEFELYLEKAHEEIGAVFHQLEVTASRAARTSANQVVPPPVPLRRVPAVHHHAPLPANKAGIHYNQRRRAGLRVSEDYYIGDLVTQGLSRQSRLNNHWNRKQQQQPQQHPLLVGGRNRWDAAEFQRRISCPGFQYNQRSGSGTKEFGLLLDQQPQKIDTVGLMPTATASPDVADGTDVQRKKKKQQPNPRRTLRRYLTADSALQLTDNGRIARQPQQQQQQQQQHHHHHQSPYHPQAIQVWTTSLMAEFNHIIDGELQRLAMANDPCADSSSPQTGKFSHAKRANTCCSTSVETGGAVELSPWARMQLALIDPVASASLNGNGLSPSPSPLRSPTSPPVATQSSEVVQTSSIQQLSADIDLVERQIFDDLDDLTLTLNNSQSPELLASCSSSSADCDQCNDCTVTGVEAPPTSSTTTTTTTTEESSHISSPLLRPQELQDFLRRVEDSIRTSNTTLDPSMDGSLYPPVLSLPDPQICQMEIIQCHHNNHHQVALSPADCELSKLNNRPESPPTFDNAGTQTSPMSLSRSSSFLWVSDCNCSGSLEDNGSVSGMISSNPLAISSATASGHGGTHSEAGSSGISRIVHMDTSMSSLVSESSAAGCGLSSTGTHCRSVSRRNRILRTPDSGAANDAEEEEEEDDDDDDDDDDEDDDDEGSSVSLSNSMDGGIGGGVESGIGTGSPPPRDRRRRPISIGDRPEVSVQTMAMSQPESDESSDLAVGDEDEEVSPLDSSDSSSTDSSLSDEDEATATALTDAKKREKVRRRETWEKIRRRHSCKRAHSRTLRNVKEKPEVVWIRRGQSETPPPPSVPLHAVPVGSAPMLTTLTDTTMLPLLEPPKVLHKPPVVVIQSVTPRPKPRPLLFKFPGSESTTTSTTAAAATSSESTPTAVKLALQSVLAMELSPSSNTNNNNSSNNSKSSSTPFLIPGGGGGATKKRHLKPISASSTPTEPYITLEIGLTAARSHSESAFAELEATEACRWLRATGFPQYAQMYEDWQFPLDLNVVERDHPFLDVDSLQALFRRLATLNRMAKLRSEKARIRPQGGDESEDEDQECALSDQWTFQRHSRRWSRIVDLPDDPTGLQALVAAGSAASSTAATAATSSGGGQPKTIEEDDPDGNRPPPNSAMSSFDETNNGSDRALNCDPVILGSFRRSSSERLRHGAKSLLRRMESLRSRSRRRPALVRPADGNLVISGPQLVDASGMEDRMKELNCVDLTPPDSSASPTSSTPSPDMNRSPAVKSQQFNSQETSSSSMISIGSPTAMTASASSTPTVEATPSPAGSMKIKRGFFQRRSFRPSTSSSKSSGSTAQSAGENEQKDAHSDSECSPSYWRRSPSSSKDANSNETTTTTAWNSLEQSLRWKSKKSREPIPADMWRASTVPPFSESTASQMSQQRGKLYLNFSKPSAPSGKTPHAGSVMSSPDEETLDLVSTPVVIRPLPAETPTPCGSLRDAERMVESFGMQNDSASTGTGTSGSHIDSDYSPAAPGRNPVVVRWHSFRRSSSSTSTMTFNSQPIAMGSLSVGQFALLRKLALLRLTALLERHTSSSKPSWGWDLPKFMRKTKSPDYKDKSMFGVPLSITVQRTAEALPKPILSAMHYLRQSALDQVGLFRKSGVRSRIAKLKELCEAWSWECSGPSGADGDDHPVDFSEHQPYDVADMVKQYFRELPEALMTNKLSETFVTIFQVVPVTQRLDALRCALLLLPDEHREALQTFLTFLTDVAALASINQMTPSNLAVCLAPSLFHLPATSASSSSSSHNRSGVNSPSNGAMGVGGGGVVPSGNGNNMSSSSGSSAPSPRRRKTVGVPDQRELSQNKAAHECLLQMINDFRHLFTVPDDIFRQCRCNYLEDSVPVTLDDLRTVEFGDWQAYMNGCMAALLKETKEKSRGWESSSNDVRVDVAWKKVGDGHALRLWRVSTEIEAPPGELLNRVLRERHLWDTSMVKWRCVVRLDKKSDVFHYTTTSEVPPVSRDVTLLRSWRTDLPRGACLVAEMSIDHSDTPITSGTVRSIVLASRYLIQPCGAGKCRLVHLSRVDIMGRSPDWYNKHYGHVSALHLARIRDSFSQHLVADGPESKV